MEQKLIWDLKELFESDDQFYKELEDLKLELKKVSSPNSLNLDLNNLFLLLNLKWNLKERANRILLYGSFNYYKNITSEETIHMKKSAEQLVSEIDSSLSYIDEMFLKLDQTTIIDFITANKQFALYQFYIDTIF